MYGSEIQVGTQWKLLFSAQRCWSYGWEDLNRGEEVIQGTGNDLRDWR